MTPTPLEQFTASQKAFRDDPSPMKALAYVRDARIVFADASGLGATVDEVTAWFAAFDAGPDMLDDPKGWVRRVGEDLRERQQRVQSRMRDFDERFADRTAGRRFSLRSKP